MQVAVDSTELFNFIARITRTAQGGGTLTGLVKRDELLKAFEDGSISLLDYTQKCKIGELETVIDTAKKMGDMIDKVTEAEQVMMLQLMAEELKKFLAQNTRGVEEDGKSMKNLVKKFKSGNPNLN